MMIRAEKEKTWRRSSPSQAVRWKRLLTLSRSLFFSPLLCLALGWFGWLLTNSSHALGFSLRLLLPHTNFLHCICFSSLEQYRTVNFRVMLWKICITPEEINSGDCQWPSMSWNLKRENRLWHPQRHKTPAAPPPGTTLPGLSFEWTLLLFLLGFQTKHVGRGSIYCSGENNSSCLGQAWDILSLPLSPQATRAFKPFLWFVSGKQLHSIVVQEDFSRRN